MRVTKNGKEVSITPLRHKMDFYMIDLRSIMHRGKWSNIKDKYKLNSTQHREFPSMSVFINSKNQRGNRLLAYKAKTKIKTQSQRGLPCPRAQTMVKDFTKEGFNKESKEKSLCARQDLSNYVMRSIKPHSTL